MGQNSENISAALLLRMLVKVTIFEGRLNGHGRKEMSSDWTFKKPPKTDFLTLLFCKTLTEPQTFG